MDNKFYSTKEVSEMLGIPLTQLSRKVYQGDVDAPQKVLGTFARTKDDVQRAYSDRN